MLPPVPVTTQTLPGSRPDISVGLRGCSGGLLRLRDAHLVGVLWGLVEVSVDDVAGRPGERRRWLCVRGLRASRRRRRVGLGELLPAVTRAGQPAVLIVKASLGVDW